MKHAVAAVAGFLMTSLALADSQIVDPSVFAPGTDVSELYEDVVLSTAQGAMVIFGTDVVEPLHLISDLTTPVFTTGTAFAHSSGDIWSAGQCCGGDQVLRADFERPTFAVAVLFMPDDTDTGVLQIYDKQDRLLDEAVFRSGAAFTISLETPNRPIAYALATFGDTGRIGTLTFDIPPRRRGPPAAE